MINIISITFIFIFSIDEIESRNIKNVKTQINKYRYMKIFFFEIFECEKNFQIFRDDLRDETSELGARQRFRKSKSYSRENLIFQDETRGEVFVRCSVEGVNHDVRV